MATDKNVKPNQRTPEQWKKIPTMLGTNPNKIPIGTNKAKAHKSIARSGKTSND